mmetsp:Transcript_25006/g.34813  ORF Transcript_25006/g.34813 Transcript_25006/m.34813 type:complete len:229 (+) Transcript_25006:1000-1686(+)
MSMYSSSHVQALTHTSVIPFSTCVLSMNCSHRSCIGHILTCNLTILYAHITGRSESIFSELDVAALLSSASAGFLTSKLSLLLSLWRLGALQSLLPLLLPLHSLELRSFFSSSWDPEGDFGLSVDDDTQVACFLSLRCDFRASSIQSLGRGPLQFALTLRGVYSAGCGTPLTVSTFRIFIRRTSLFFSISGGKLRAFSVSPVSLSMCIDITSILNMSPMRLHSYTLLT